MSKVIIMSAYTTLGIGGRAELEVIKTEREALTALKNCSFVLGNGSNLLVSDSGINGLVVKNGMKKFRFDKSEVCADGGCSLSSLALVCSRMGLSGLEWAYRLPASVGGAIASNAGAFGGQISDCVQSVRLIRRGEIITLNSEDCGFSYRQSGFCKGDFILSARLKLRKATASECMSRLAIVASGRASQPKGKSAGCIYKSVGKSAGWYIERAGLKGKRIGDVFVSPVHAGFFINDGKATARDVVRLMDYVEKKVLDDFGVTLLREIKLIGEF